MGVDLGREWEKEEGQKSVGPVKMGLYDIEDRDGRWERNNSKRERKRVSE